MNFVLGIAMRNLLPTTTYEAAEWLGLASGLHRMLDGVEVRVSPLAIGH